MGGKGSGNFTPRVKKGKGGMVRLEPQAALELAAYAARVGQTQTSICSRAVLAWVRGSATDDPDDMYIKKPTGN